MSGNILSPLSARASFAGRAVASDEHSILLTNAAILTAIIIGCTVVGIAALFSDDILRRASSLGAFVAIQTVVFAFETSPYLAVAVLTAGYISLSVNRWDATFALSLLCVAIAVGNYIRYPR